MSLLLRAAGRRRLHLAVAAISVSLAASAHAQSTASVTGTVKDPSGAVLPGATVTLHNLGTGTDRVTRTDSAGDYSLPSLQPADYSLTVHAEGFSDYILRRLELQVDQHIDLPIPMSVAAAGATIEVDTAAPVIDTGSITVGQVVDKATVQEIPLNGRHFLDLTTLTPGGVTAPANGNLTVPSRGVGGFSFLTAGNRDDSVNFQINGINLNDINNAQIVFQPSINTTSEVKINNSTFSAEYGRNSGSIVNVSTRSGTNQFHGEVFEYLRNNALDARNWFNYLPQPQNSLKRSNFGAAVGGPIWRNKTFFFASYEGLRQAQTLQLNTTVPTNAQRAAVTDPVVKNLLALIPVDNGGETTSAGNYAGAAAGPVRIDQGTIDLLYIISPADTVHGFYAYQYDQRTEPSTQGDTVPGFGDHRPGTRQLVTVNETHVFSPRLVNEVRFGMNRVNVAFLENYTATAASLGMNNFPAGVTPAAGIPYTGISGYSLEFGGPGGFPSGRYDSLGVFADTATWTLGKNVIKFGGEGRRYLNANFAGDPGTLTFGQSAAETNAAGATVIPAYTAIQNFERGYATSFSITPNQTTSRIFGNAVGAFVMDSIKITPNLLFEAGFRFEWLGAPTFGGMKASIFDPVTVTLNPYGSPGYTQPFNQNYNYQPRLGFTYDAFGNNKTVIRGGYAITSDQPLSSVVTSLSSNAPYTNKVSYVATSTGSCAQGASTCLPAIPVENLYNLAAAAAITVGAVQRNFHNAYTETFNLNVDQEVWNGLALNLGYYGSVGKHLRSTQNINEIFPQTGARAFTKLAANSPIAANASLNANLNQASSTGMSNYNALWFNARKNFASGFEINATYQYAKSLDEGSTAGTAFTDITQPRLNYGLSDFDVRHRISGNGIYNFPFKGNRLIEGWRIAGILQWQTGNPLNITTTSTYTGTSSVQHPSLLQPIHYVKVYNAPGSVQWFAPGSDGTPGSTVCSAPTAAGCTFYAPTTGFGTMERNGAKGPGFADYDMSLYKTTKIFENVNFQLRIDAFDVFNHPSFGNPGTSAVNPSGSFGVITSTRFPVGDLGSSRQLQIAGKFIF